jgi:hypothetical protein
MRTKEGILKFNHNKVRGQMRVRFDGRQIVNALYQKQDKNRIYSF